MVEYTFAYCIETKDSSLVKVMSFYLKRILSLFIFLSLCLYYLKRERNHNLISQETEIK